MSEPEIPYDTCLIIATLMAVKSLNIWAEENGLTKRAVPDILRRSASEDATDPMMKGSLEFVADLLERKDGGTPDWFRGIIEGGKQD